MSYVNNFYGFCASLWYLTSGKDFMVIRPAVPEVLAPQMPVKLSKRADAVNKIIFMRFISQIRKWQLRYVRKMDSSDKIPLIRAKGEAPTFANPRRNDSFAFLQQIFLLVFIYPKAIGGGQGQKNHV